jgi:hypothetical protein
VPCADQTDRFHSLVSVSFGRGGDFTGTTE